MIGTSALCSRPPSTDIDDSVAVAAAPVLERETFIDIRRHMALEACKWDPQVEDVSILQPFPLLLRRAQWRYLAACAEALSRETCAAELALLERPDLLRKLAVPPRLAPPILRGLRSKLPAADEARVMRFDFHPAQTGWCVSEVNSDVPGGFSEASEFPSLMSEHYPGYAPAGAPGPDLASALARRIEDIGGRQPAALIWAAGFMEDLQVVSYLAGLLRRRGIETRLVNPWHLRFDCGKGSLLAGGGCVPLSLIVRFHQAEWLSRRRHAAVAPYLLGDAETPVINPGYAILSESKRFPLVWDDLHVEMSTWRRLLPETRDPREIGWRRDARWLLKTAFCNTGDSVSSPLTMPRRDWFRSAAEATLFPNQWVAQRRFESLAIDTPLGSAYPCIGVYTIGGRAAGIYGRLSRTPVVTYAAADVAVLVEEESE
ncbi:MAG: glutathionylspermidine synthase family protein [Gammaproteobacteria bacterium]